MMKKIFNASVVAFVVLGLIYFGIRVSNFDWSKRQDYPDLKERLSYVIGEYGSPADIKCFDKVSILGCTVEYRLDAESGSVEDYVSKRARDRGWILVKNEYVRGIQTKGYCDGAGFVRIDMVGLDSGVRLLAGSYWAADPGSDRFCRD